MTAIPGAPDFQGQGAASVVLIEIVTINANLTDSFTLTADLFQPHFHGLEFVWIPSFATGGVSIDLVGLISGPNISVDQPLACPPGVPAIISTLGAVFTNEPTWSLQFDVSAVATAQGQLFVFGLTAPLLHVPARKLEYEGIAQPFGPIVVGPAATAVVIPAPTDIGTYWRVKSLSWRHSAAPAAGGVMEWQTTPGALAFHGSGTGAVLPSNDSIEMDALFTGAVSLSNGSTQNVRAYALAELWRS